MKTIQIVECPRDAMQGIKEWIPTELKIEYLNQLLTLGFHTLDFGSFVSAKAIPQLADTVQVLDKLDLSSTETKLLAIVANTRGAEEACQYTQISYLRFPLSVSETFQLRNTNKSIQEAWVQVQEIQALCVKNNKTLVVYLSMAFGNPYQDPWEVSILAEWTEKLVQAGITIVSLADTIGSADPKDIQSIFSSLIPAYPHINIGAHFHAKPNDWESKLSAAFESGCTRFDGALKGYGGCPMAKDDLTGNMATENIISFLENQSVKSLQNKGISTINWPSLEKLYSVFEICNRVFSHA